MDALILFKMGLSRMTGGAKGYAPKNLSYLSYNDVTQLYLN